MPNVCDGGRGQPTKNLDPHPTIEQRKIPDHSRKNRQDPHSSGWGGVGCCADLLIFGRCFIKFWSKQTFLILIYTAKKKLSGLGREGLFR